MAKPFHELGERLLAAGVAPRHVRRYLGELTEHLADLRAEEERDGRSRAEAESTALLRLGGTEVLAQAMIDRRQFQSWSMVAPWATFGFVPLALLAAAWAVALFILWSGWNIFLPGSATPFIRLGGPAALYFGVGRLIYFCAPVLAGWEIALVAARQRLKGLWPAVGFLLVALIGGSGQVHVSRPAVPGGHLHVSMGFTLASSVQGRPGGLFHALVLLSIIVLPYLAWRFQKTYSFLP